ncbi:hypothetical protein ACVWW1_004400 [Bradyrhizobium sp. JR3.5]
MRFSRKSMERYDGGRFVGRRAASAPVDLVAIAFR